MLTHLPGNLEISCDPPAATSQPHCAGPMGDHEDTYAYFRTGSDASKYTFGD
jgi:hypothetical protein